MYNTPHYIAREKEIERLGKKATFLERLSKVGLIIAYILLVVGIVASQRVTQTHQNKNAQSSSFEHLN